MWAVPGPGIRRRRPLPAQRQARPQLRPRRRSSSCDDAPFHRRRRAARRAHRPRLTASAPSGGVVRLLPDGYLDFNFGYDGIFSPGRQLGLVPDQRRRRRCKGILVGGMNGYLSEPAEHWYGSISRITPNGRSGRLGRLDDAGRRRAGGAEDLRQRLSARSRHAAFWGRFAGRARTGASDPGRPRLGWSRGPSPPATVAGPGLELRRRSGRHSLGFFHQLVPRSRQRSRPRRRKSAARRSIAQRGAARRATVRPGAARSLLRPSGARVALSPSRCRRRGERVAVQARRRICGRGHAAAYGCSRSRVHELLLVRLRAQFGCLRPPLRRRRCRSSS